MTGLAKECALAYMKCVARFVWTGKTFAERSVVRASARTHHAREKLLISDFRLQSKNSVSSRQSGSWESGNPNVLYLCLRARASCTQRDYLRLTVFIRRIGR